MEESFKENTENKRPLLKIQAPLGEINSIVGRKVLIPKVRLKEFIEKENAVPVINKPNESKVVTSTITESRTLLRRLSTDPIPDHEEKILKIDNDSPFSKDVEEDQKNNKDIQLCWTFSPLSSDDEEDSILRATINNIIQFLDEEVEDENIHLTVHNSAIDSTQINQSNKVDFEHSSISKVCTDVTSDVCTDVTSDVYTDVTSDVCTDVTSDVCTDVTSDVCTDVTSNLALDSSKNNTNDKTTNLDGKLKDTNENEKLFPIFYPRPTNPRVYTNKKVVVKNKFKLKILPKAQMLLDVGQKKFTVTFCHECNFLYHQGDPSEEIVHINHHSAKYTLAFRGWKNERIVADYGKDGRILHLKPDDSKMWWKKVSDLMDVINRDIGCYDMEFSLDNCQAFLYIKEKTIVGCLIANEESVGYQLVLLTENDSDLCSQNAHPIKCGVSRIWVLITHRKQKIATKMMNSLKSHFISGSTLNDCDIAINSLTEDGKRFCKSYFKTNYFYVY